MRLTLGCDLGVSRLIRGAGAVASPPAPPPPPPPAPGFDPTTLHAGSVGVWFDPAATAHLWQDAAGTQAVTADGQPVGRIEDLSGNGHHATQADGAAQPLYRTDGTRHWLEFPTGKEFLAFEGAALASDYPLEMMVAFEVFGTHSYGTLLACQGGSSGPSVLCHAQDVYHYVAPSNTTVITNNNSLPLNTPLVTGLHCAAGQLEATVNGASVGSAARANGWGVSSQGRIGWNGNGAVTIQARFFGGLSISRALDVVERDGMGGVLADRVGAPQTLQGSAVYLGDSTVAGFAGGAPLVSLIDTPRPEIEVAQSADTAAGQQARWTSLVSDPTAVGWVGLQIGLNDIKQATATTSSVLADLQALVDQIRQDAPQATVVMAQMIPARTYWEATYSAPEAAAIQQRWVEVNAAIAGQGAQPITNVTGRVTAHVTEMEDGTGALKPAYDTGDGIHPSTAGRQVMADAWVAAITATGTPL